MKPLTHLLWTVWLSNSNSRSRLGTSRDLCVSVPMKLNIGNDSGSTNKGRVIYELILSYLQKWKLQINWNKGICCFSPNHKDSPGFIFPFPKRSSQVFDRDWFVWLTKNRTPLFRFSKFRFFLKKNFKYSKQNISLNTYFYSTVVYFAGLKFPRIHSWKLTIIRSQWRIQDFP